MGSIQFFKGDFVVAARDFIVNPDPIGYGYFEVVEGSVGVCAADFGCHLRGIVWWVHPIWQAHVHAEVAIGDLGLFVPVLPRDRYILRTWENVFQLYQERPTD